MFKLTKVQITNYPSGEGLKYSSRPMTSEPNDKWVVVERRETLYFASHFEAKDLERFDFRTPQAEMLEAYRLWSEPFKFSVDGFVHEVINQATLRELLGLLNFRITRALSQLNWE